MKALRFHRTGSLDELRVEEVPAPVPQSGEALVQVRAAAVNPSDAKNVLGRMPRTTLPRTPGRDFAGVVVEGPAHLLGTEVFGGGGDLGFGRDGTHAEFVALPAAALVPKPAALSFAQAAALGVAHLTAWAALVRAANLQPGETVLITGVTGAVGGTAARLARWRGAGRVLGTVRGTENRPTDLPVDVYLDLKADPDLPTAVLAATGNRGVDVVLDVVGGPLFEGCLRCLAPRGRQVAIASPGDGRVSFNLRDFYHREARLFGADSLALTLEESAAILRGFLPGLEAGVFPPPALELWPLEQARALYARLEAGPARTKPVFDLNPAVPGPPAPPP